MSRYTGELVYDLGAPPRRHTAQIVFGIASLLAIGASLAWAPLQVTFIILGVTFWILPIINLELGFYGMILLLPLPEARLAIGDTFTISFSSLVLVSIILGLLTKRVIRRSAILGFQASRFWPLWAFVLANFASLATSVNLPRSLNIFIHLIVWVLLLLVTGQVVVNRRMLRTVLLLMIAEGVVISLIGFYDNFVNRIQISALYHYTGGVASIYSNRNQYGNYLIFIIPMAVAFVIYDRHLMQKLMNLGALFALALSLIFTFSRGAWLGCLFGLSVFMRNWRAWVLALVAIMAIYYFTPENIRIRFRSIWDPNVKSANTSRMLIQLSGLRLWLQHPVLGVGTGNFEIAVAGTRVSSLLPTRLSAHNTYLEMLAETGVIGFGAFVWFIWFITTKVWRIKVKPGYQADMIYKLALLSAWLALIIHLVVITAFFNSMPWFLIGLIFAADRILARDEEELPSHIS